MVSSEDKGSFNGNGVVFATHKLSKGDGFGAHTLTVDDPVAFNPVFINKADGVWFVACFQKLKIADEAVCQIDGSSVAFLQGYDKIFRLSEYQCLKTREGRLIGCDQKVLLIIGAERGNKGSKKCCGIEDKDNG